MKKTMAVALTLSVALLAVTLPVWLAIHESQRLGLQAESARVLAYAREVIHRSDITTSQFAQASETLARMQGDEPCSDAIIERMRQIDLASSQLQAIGYVEDGRIICSSLGRDITDFSLGAPDYVTSRGVAVRRHLTLPFVSNQSFIAFERKKFIAIIHKDSPIDVSTGEKDVSLALYSLLDQSVLASRGHMDRAWLVRLGEGSALTFSDGQYVVALVKSAGYRTAALAAVPMRHVSMRTETIAMRLVPVGITAGAILAAAILFLARMQMAIPAAIRAGIKRKEFYLLYQPIVDLRTRKWVGVEALIRWKRSTGELMDPDFFIPLAERNNLIMQLTKYVLEVAAREAGSFLRAHPEFHVAINLSAADLHSPDLGQHVDRLLAETGALPSNVIAEMTERSLLNLKVARETTRNIRARGFAVAIDDFGTGYSSLSYLEALEVDFLKIDKSFVDAIATEAPTSQVVQHIIEMAKDLNLQMIAEGIETEVQAEFLFERGVQFGQGWLFGKAMRFTDIEHHMGQSL